MRPDEYFSGRPALRPRIWLGVLCIIAVIVTMWGISNCQTYYYNLSSAVPSILRTIYVNNSSGCPGSGTGGAPYCAIQSALTNALAGDDIRIQAGTGTYTECNDTIAVTGTAAHPIYIESDNPSAQPVLRCNVPADNDIIQVGGAVNYLIFQNITIDGTGIAVPPFAIQWLSSTGASDLVGDQFLNSTVKNWGASNVAAYTQGNQNGYWQATALGIGNAYGILITAKTISGFVVQGNTFSGNRYASIEMISDKGTIIKGNSFDSPICGTRNGNGAGPGAVGLINDIHDTAGTNQWPDNSDIAGNTFTNHTNSTCPTGITIIEDAGVHADVGNWNGVIEQNVFYNFTANRSGGAIFIEQDCFNWTVKNNLINKYGSGPDVPAGIFTHPTLLTSGDVTGTNFVYNNTIANVSDCGLRVDGSGSGSGSATVVKNNILYNNGTQFCYNPNNNSNMTLTTDYNSYWDLSGGGNVGLYQSYTVVNFANWKTDTGGDSHGLNASPNMVNPVTTAGYSLLLNAGSPAINAGVTLAAVPVDFLNFARPQGTAYCMGAYEYPQ